VKVVFALHSSCSYCYHLSNVPYMLVLLSVDHLSQQHSFFPFTTFSFETFPLKHLKHFLPSVPLIPKQQQNNTKTTQASLG